MAPELRQKLDHGSSVGGGGGVTSTHHTLYSRGNTVSVPGLAHRHQAAPVTVGLFDSKLASLPIDLDEPLPLSLGWQKVLDLKTGTIYYRKEYSWCLGETTMSRNGKSPRLDLKLNISPPRVNHPRVESPSRSASMSPTSPQSSCVSTELNPDETLHYSSSPEATSMLLVGCPRCLMYVMLSEEDPKCPQCKSTVLLDFLHDSTMTTTPNSKRTRKN